jgi:glutamate--cysteine ligase catalytic subunit
MVIERNDQEKNAKLSLRQTEILAELASIVSNICEGCPEE